MELSVKIATLIFFFVTVSVFSLLLNGLLLKFAKTLGIRNNDTVIRWSGASKPALGGISFYICFLISIAVYAVFFNDANKPLYHDKQLLGILASTAIAFLMGLSDDAYNTKPLFKLFTQIICGIILIFSGVCISLFESDIANYFLTIFWVVGIMNSINMLDNMDAVTSLVSVFIILASITLFFMNHHFPFLHLLMLIGVLASLCGFLFYNWYPSKIFMGDTGSQFLGVFLASIGIMYFWNDETNFLFEAKTKHIVIVALAFIVPIVDTTTVTINRILRKQSPFIGGRDHTTHTLSYLGFSDSKVALIIAGISFFSYMLIVFINLFFETWTYVYFSVFAAYVLIVFSILFGCTRLQKVKKKINV